jgi:uncharacterized protein YigA (DUF484 family)
MNNSNLTPMTEDDIAHYLGTNPEFFERHAELLAAVHLTSPHSRRTVSLQERQAEMLRDKIRMLEGRIMEMIRHGNDNLNLSDKLLSWARDLFLAQKQAGLPELMADTIQTQFSVPQVAIRVWGVAPRFAAAAFAQGVSDDARVFASSLREPFCGVNSGFEATSWLAEPAQATSLALLPLRPVDGASTAPAFGMLVLASPDAQRFTSTMGTDFLERIAGLASAALSPLR